MVLHFQRQIAPKLKHVFPNCFRISLHGWSNYKTDPRLESRSKWENIGSHFYAELQPSSPRSAEGWCFIRNILTRTLATPPSPGLPLILKPIDESFGAAMLFPSLCPDWPGWQLLPGLQSRALLWSTCNTCCFDRLCSLVWLHIFHWEGGALMPASGYHWGLDWDSSAHMVYSQAGRVYQVALGQVVLMVER